MAAVVTQNRYRGGCRRALTVNFATGTKASMVV